MFNDRLIELRKLNNDTQESLAKRLFVSRSLVAKWEQGRSFPSFNELNKICELYNVEFESLLSKSELKTQYGNISNKNKNKNLLVMILSILIGLIIIVGSIIIYNIETHSKIIHQSINISSIKVNANEFNPRETKLEVILEDNTSIKDIMINPDGTSSNGNYIITFNDMSYSNIMLNYVTSGNYVSYKIIEKYNVFNQVVKIEKSIEKIDLNPPLLNGEDKYVKGVYLSLNPSNLEFDKEYCLFADYSKNNGAISIEGNFFSLKISRGLVCEDSNLPYEKITCDFEIDKEKLHEFINENDTIKLRTAKLVFVYSNGEISFYTINNFVLEKEVKEYAVDPWTIDYDDHYPLSCFFFQDPSVNKLYNVYFEFNIIDKSSPTHYEIFEFDEQGNYVNKHTLYNYEDLLNIEFHSDAYRLQVNVVNNDKLLDSYYVNKGEKIKMFLSNDYGIFSSESKIFD